MPRLVAIVIGVLTLVPCRGHAQVLDRAALIAALEHLIATGDPARTADDDGQRLQVAVTEAIARGDREIELLAVRASTSLVASVSRPVSSTADLPAIGVSARRVLAVQRPATFVAVIYVSVDGGELVEAGRTVSDKGWGSRLDKVLPAAALLPGFHEVRVHARLRFRDADGKAWTEARDLPSIAYALFDPATPDPDGPAGLLLAPRALRAPKLDASLPDVPFGDWLTDLVKRDGSKGANGPDWMSQFCSERTRRTVVARRSGPICAVAGMTIAGEVFRVWIRTGDLTFGPNGPEWAKARPALDGIDAAGSGTGATTLAEWVQLLDLPQGAWPIGDIAVAPDDITFSLPDPSRGNAVTVTVTVRNHGQVDLHAARVSFAAGHDPGRRQEWRDATVDVPRLGSADLTFEAVFPQGYGFVFVHAMNSSERSPHDTFTFDPTPLDACAFRIYQPGTAPRTLAQTVAESSGGCRGW